MLCFIIIIIIIIDVNSVSCDKSPIQSDAEFLIFFVVATEIA